MDADIQQRWLMAALALGGAVALGYIARAVVVHRLAAIVSRTSTELDDLLLTSTRRQIPFWFLLGGLVLSARLAPLSERAYNVVDRLASVGLVLSLCFAAATLGTELLARFTREAGTTVATTSITQNVLRIVVFITGGLLILSNLGVSITPLLTALGVGSLAVALALQPTLSNLFAGLHLAMARPIRPGDFVSLENGMQGYVDDIGWRTTMLKDLGNNVIIVPNQRVVDMIVTNFSKPEPMLTVTVGLGVGYRSDLRRVEEVTLDVAREVMADVPGGVGSFEPVVWFNAFGDSAIQLTVVLRGSQFADRARLIHETIMRLKERYEAEGIEIPFPQRVVHHGSEAAPGRPA
ncbi:MAG TPA: mechanosensitive ion channel family protein [Candidatus Polarisedimenticolia bacterium]|nr:mechanosensitive ion channel family protein [Candidatus Polarisedimenticolia bacterium]